MTQLSALIADDEEGPCEQLVGALQRCWPELSIVQRCANGIDAWDSYLLYEPDICFLDIRMPGLSGLEVAHRIGHRAAVILVTAFSEHALAAFEVGAIDYVLKPVEDFRLRQTIERLRARLQAPQRDAEEEPFSAPSPLVSAGANSKWLYAFEQLLAHGMISRRPPCLSVIQATVGREIRFIQIAEVVYFEASTRYVRVVWQVDGRNMDALLRMPLKELLPQLDEQQFWQVHRAVIVRSDRIAAAVRSDEGQMHLKLRGHPDILPVSRQFQSLFRGQ